MIEAIKEISSENARQSKLMANVAYDTKRDSEVMTTITVATRIYLPATFLCVRSLTPEIAHWDVHLMIFNVDGLQHGVLPL